VNSTYLSGVAGLILVGIFHRELGELPATAQRLPGLLIWIVGALAVLMMLEEYWRGRQARAGRAAQAPAATVAGDGGDGGDGAGDSGVSWRLGLGFAVATAAYVWLIPILGYPIATIGFVGGTLLASRIIRPVVAIVYALGITAFVWLVFIWALGLPAPIAPWLD